MCFMKEEKQVLGNKRLVRISLEPLEMLSWSPNEVQVMSGEQESE